MKTMPETGARRPAKARSPTRMPGARLKERPAAMARKRKNMQAEKTQRDVAGKPADKGQRLTGQRVRET